MKQRILPLVGCFLAVILCLAYARYRGDLSPWWRSHGGGIPYVLFWVLLWFSAFPARKYVVPICVGCVLFTCLLEFGQLWNPEPLAAFRKTRFGAALLGSSFVWSDLPPYFLGGLAGWISLLAILRVQIAGSPAQKLN